MGLLKSRSVVCPVNQHCSQWARINMGYCLCSPTDWCSLCLGMISVLSWGVAEIPQILTNYRSKSAEGLSILFLVTWIVGDLLNLFGCMLEPATLPTQYFMAVLFLIATVLLFAQAVYYGHIYPRLKSNGLPEAVHTGAVERREKCYVVDAEKINIPSSAVPIASISPDATEGLFFMSARYLSVCNAPPVGSLLTSRTHTPDVEQYLFNEPLLSEYNSTQSASPPKVKTMFCVVSLMTFFLSSCNWKLAEIHNDSASFKGPAGGIVMRIGRRLFEAKAPERNGIGTHLGWGMAAIYMGGRLPQIFLNFRKGNAKGLNPLMFVFALLGNITYVLSILFKSLDWLKLRPNLPWLVESSGCVILDIIILFQFFFYRYRSRNEVEKKYVS